LNDKKNNKDVRASPDRQTQKYSAFFINVLAQHKMGYQRNKWHAEKSLASLRGWLNAYTLRTDKMKKPS